MAAPMNSNSASSRKFANVNVIQAQRTPSQASTSIKAEPGSNRVCVFNFERKIPLCKRFVRLVPLNYI